MKRWIGLACVLALGMIVTSASPARADITDLYIDITEYEPNPTPGSTFDVSFKVHVPDDVSIPSSTPSKPCFFYYQTFYFEDGNIKYPAEGYWWGDYKGSVFYDANVTDYTVKVKMKTGDDAPVGKKFYLGIYWKIPLEADWENTGDNITFTIPGDNTYTLPVVGTKEYPDYTRYTLFHGPTSDIYVRTDHKDYLYVRTLKAGLTVTAAPGFEIPLWPIVAGVVVLLVVGAAIALARRRGGGEFSPALESFYLG